MKKKRIRERIHLTQPLRVFDMQAERLLGYLYDISDMGISVTGKRLIPTNSFKKLGMELPEPIEGRDHFRFDAISTWNKPGPEEGHFQIGFQMLNISKRDVETLKLLVERFRLPEEKDEAVAVEGNAPETEEAEEKVEDVEEEAAAEEGTGGEEGEEEI